MYMVVVQKEPKQKTKLRHHTPKVTSKRTKHEMAGMAGMAGRAYDPKTDQPCQKFQGRYTNYTSLKKD